jgi:hypothetical protein
MRGKFVACVLFLAIAVQPFCLLQHQAEESAAATLSTDSDCHGSVPDPVPAPPLPRKCCGVNHSPTALLTPGYLPPEIGIVFHNTLFIATSASSDHQNRSASIFFSPPLLSSSSVLRI